MKKIKSSILGELPQLMKDFRRHYIPYIDNLCRLRSKTRRRPMVGRDTFHVLTGVDKSSIRLVGTRVSRRESRTRYQPASPSQTFAIYFLQCAGRIFTVFTTVELFFTLPR